MGSHTSRSSRPVPLSLVDSPPASLSEEEIEFHEGLRSFASQLRKNQTKDRFSVSYSESPSSIDWFSIPAQFEDQKQVSGNQRVVLSTDTMINKSIKFLLNEI